SPEHVKTLYLPDWWEDDLASVPSNRAIAELCISRATGIPIADLRNPECELSLPPVEISAELRRALEGKLPSTVANLAALLVVETKCTLEQARAFLREKGIKATP